MRVVVQEVHELLSVQMKLRERVKLYCRVADDVPEFIEMDYQRLKQILINLLRNSTKFTFAGYIVIGVTKS